MIVAVLKFLILMGGFRVWSLICLLMLMMVTINPTGNDAFDIAHALFGDMLLWGMDSSSEHPGRCSAISFAARYQRIPRREICATWGAMTQDFLLYPTGAGLLECQDPY